MALERERNAAEGGADGEIGAAGAAVRTLVVHAREDLEIARGVRAVVGAGTVARGMPVTRVGRRARR